jgi:hypothetical protein
MNILFADVKVDQPIWKDITQKNASILKKIKERRQNETSRFNFKANQHLMC